MTSPNNERLDVQHLSIEEQRGVVGGKLTPCTCDPIWLPVFPPVLPGYSIDEYAP